MTKAFSGNTGELLVCDDRQKESNHIFVGRDFHGSARCSCGGTFRKLSLVERLEKRKV